MTRYRACAIRSRTSCTTRNPQSRVLPSTFRPIAAATIVLMTSRMRKMACSPMRSPPARPLPSNRSDWTAASWTDSVVSLSAVARSNSSPPRLRIATSQELVNYVQAFSLWIFEASLFLETKLYLCGLELRPSPSHFKFLVFFGTRTNPIPSNKLLASIVIITQTRP